MQSNRGTSRAVEARRVSFSHEEQPAKTAHRRFVNGRDESCRLDREFGSLDELDRAPALRSLDEEAAKLAGLGHVEGLDAEHTREPICVSVRKVSGRAAGARRGLTGERVRAVGVVAVETSKTLGVFDLDLGVGASKLGDFEEGNASNVSFEVDCECEVVSQPLGEETTTRAYACSCPQRRRRS